MSEAPKNVFVKMTEGYESNWWGVVTHPYDEDGVEYVRADLVEAKLAKAVQHIEWFISEDETNRGDEPMPERRGKTWNEINAYWIEHLDSAIAFVAELKGDKP